MKEQEQKQIIALASSFFPNNFNQELKEYLKADLHEQLSQLVLSTEREAIQKFCERKDLCPICITGGWDCSSDHK